MKRPHLALLILLTLCLTLALATVSHAQIREPLAAAAEPSNTPRDYYWTWYDNVNAQNWVLMANPEGSSSGQTFELSVGSQKQDLSPYALLSADCQEGLCEAGQVPEGMALTPNFPALMGGPVKASSLDGSKAIVSQRTLWAGSSLDEVPGTEATRLSSHFYWTWYDQISPGYTNWILIANPNQEPVSYEITIGGKNLSGFDGATGTIQPGENATPTFPGIMGGPVEVRAWVEGGSYQSESDRRDVMASQRVLSNFGLAFNEEPGIPEEELSDHYLWTWYDMKEPGAANWVLVANPGDEAISYQITIGGEDPGPGSSGTIKPGDKVTPTFPSKRGGPVEVKTWKDGGSWDNEPDRRPAIASQRVVWGPSFEETPGYPASGLASEYHWTWYDQQSLGAANWVLVANPNDTPVYYEITIGHL